jgi:dihydrofolate reductase
VTPGRYRFEGHAIVGDDDRICEADGSFPQALRNDADFAYFQGHLDRAAIVVTGRNGHEAHPNKPGRRRLVFTSHAPDGLFVDAAIAFFDPARRPLGDALRALAPEGGVVAVTGGGPVFDWFAAEAPYDAFHLVRAHGVRVEGGRPIFADAPAERKLRALGLAAPRTRWLSEHERIELRLFLRIDPAVL